MHDRFLNFIKNKFGGKLKNERTKPAVQEQYIAGFVLKEKKYKLLHENLSKLLKTTNQKV